MRYREAVEAAPRHAAAHLNLGTALEALGEAQRRRPAYETALELDPWRPTPVTTWANCSTRGARCRAGGPTAHDALRLKPDFPEALVVLASVQEALETWSFALDSLQAALRQRPRTAGAQRSSDYCSRMGRWSDAEAVLRRARPGCRALYWLERAVNLERPEEAAACFREAMSSPRLPDPLHLAASWWITAGWPRRARFARAIELKPAFAEAHVGLGNLHHAGGSSRTRRSATAAPRARSPPPAGLRQPRPRARRPRAAG